VDWWGWEADRRSRFAVVGASGGWWRRLRCQRALTLRVAEAALVAGLLAGLVTMLAASSVAEKDRTEMAMLEQQTREKARLLEVRRCLEWPDWCSRTAATSPVEGDQAANQVKQKVRLVGSSRTVP
jgi:hypothetical protein